MIDPTRSSDVVLESQNIEYYCRAGGRGSRGADQGSQDGKGNCQNVDKGHGNVDKNIKNVKHEATRQEATLLNLRLIIELRIKLGTDYIFDKLSYE